VFENYTTKCGLLLVLLLVLVFLSELLLAAETFSCKNSSAHRVASNASPRTVDGAGFLSGVGVVVVGGGFGGSGTDDASAAAPILAVRVRFLMR
jgi:hypothetical protein